MINIPFRTPISYNRYAFLLALFFTLFLNWHFFLAVKSALDVIPSVKVGFVISIPIFLLLCLNFLFQLFAWPWMTKPFFIILLLLSGIVSYAEVEFGTIFDEAMWTNVLETNVAEAQTYFNFSSMMGFIGLSILPAILFGKIKLKSVTSWPRFILQKMGYIVLSFFGIGCIGGVYYQDYASVGRNNSYLRDLIVPTYFVKSAYDYIKDEYFTVQEPFQHLGLDAHQETTKAEQKPTLIVMMLGETSRAQNDAYYGYPRDTNPYTRRFDPYVFQATSCGTATAVSVPCMFSNMNRTEFSRDEADNQDNALDVLQRADVKIYWLDNDSGSKGVADRVPNHTLSPKDNKQLCLHETCYDEALLEGFNKLPKKPDGDRFIVLHLMGSHGPTYYQRYPKSMRFFTPDCPRSDIENCSPKELMNTYDNTIRYVDYVNAQVLERLKALEDQYNVGFLYLSDHGESLGEDGLYLHGMPYAIAPDYQTHIPFLMWFSDGFMKAQGLDRQCILTIAKNRKFSQDNIFDTLLGLFDVKTKIYHDSQDMLHACRHEKASVAKSFNH